MNPFRLDVLGVTILLAAPVLSMSAGGTLTADQALMRFLACWVAATVGLGLLNMHLAAAQAEAERLAKIRADLDALLSDDDEPGEDDSADTADAEPTTAATPGQNRAGVSGSSNESAG